MSSTYNIYFINNYSNKDRNIEINEVVLILLTVVVGGLGSVFFRLLFLVFKLRTIKNNVG